MSEPVVDPPVVRLTPDERAAARAFLQRCDVRLSTMHRVATALLSGAGILVLLPAVERDSVVQVLRTLLTGTMTWSKGLTVIAVVVAISLTLVVLWLLVLELTRFYFHSNHVVNDGVEVFTPRFTLTGLRLPTDEMGDDAAAALRMARTDPANVSLLVPANDRSRAQIDRQARAYPGLLTGHDDPARAEMLFALAAARERSLLDEVAKVEFGMARHMLRLQVIVLRYVKALLVVVCTALTTYIASAAVQNQDTLTAADQRWIAGTMAMWAPAIILVVTSPVRWLEKLLKSEGATSRAAVRRDPELTHVEDTTVRLAVIGWVSSYAALITLLVHHDMTDLGRVAAFATLASSLVLQGVALALWRGGHTWWARFVPGH